MLQKATGGERVERKTNSLAEAVLKRLSPQVDRHFAAEAGTKLPALDSFDRRLEDEICPESWFLVVVISGFCVVHLRGKGTGHRGTVPTDSMVDGLNDGARVRCMR